MKMYTYLSDKMHLKSYLDKTGFRSEKSPKIFNFFK
jgi:hypothetical protein